MFFNWIENISIDNEHDKNYIETCIEHRIHKKINDWLINMFEIKFDDVIFKNDFEFCDDFHWCLNWFVVHKFMNFWNFFLNKFVDWIIKFVVVKILTQLKIELKHFFMLSFYWLSYRIYDSILLKILEIISRIAS